MNAPRAPSNHRVAGDTHDESEERLLARARAGDGRAFGELVLLHDEALRRLAYRLLGDRDAMDDALQEAYVKAFGALPRFAGRAAFATWLYRIVYNTCLDQLRRRQAPSTPLPDTTPAPDEDPADAIGRRASLATALALLPPPERAIVLLVDADGLSYDAAAAIVGVPTGTVASRLSRARATLRRALRAEHEGVSS